MKLHIAADAWGRRERGRALLVIGGLLAIVALLIFCTDLADAAGPGRTVTVRVPAGGRLHVYPEADRGVEDVRWRCATARRWRPAVDGGWSPGCTRVVLTAGFHFDFEVGPGPGQQAVGSWPCG